MKKSKFRCTLLLVLMVVLLNSSIFASAHNNRIQSFEPTSLIKSDGTYWVWGENQVAPVQIHGVVDVEKSFSNRFIMTKDKAVFYWERNILSGAYQIYNVNKLNNLIDLQSSFYDLLALDQEGKVHHLSLADGLNYNQLDKIKPLDSIDDVIAIGNYYDENYKERWVFLKSDGSVWTNKVEFPSEDFKPILFLEDIMDIDENIALKKDGTVWTMPHRNIEADQDIIATPISELTNIQTIKSFGIGKTNIAIDKNATLWFWGGTVTGHSDQTAINKQSAPVNLTSIKNVKDAFVVDRTLVVLTHDGKVYKTSIEREIMPENPVFDLLMTDAYQIKSARHMIIQKNDGTLWGWGFNKYAELGVGDYEWMHNSLKRMQKPVSVYLNKESIVLNSGVLIRNGQAFIPLRSIFEKMGATINWDGNSKAVTVNKSETNKPPIDIVINYISGEVFMNNQPVILSNPSFIMGSTAYIPLRFVSESLGAKVEWIHDEDKILILMQ